MDTCQLRVRREGKRERQLLETSVRCVNIYFILNSFVPTCRFVYLEKYTESIVLFRGVVFLV